MANLYGSLLEAYSIMSDENVSSLSRPKVEYVIFDLDGDSMSDALYNILLTGNSLGLMIDSERVYTNVTSMQFRK